MILKNSYLVLKHLKFTRLQFSYALVTYVTRNEKRETKRETRTVRETKLPGFASIRNEEREKQKIELIKIYKLNIMTICRF